MKGNASCHIPNDKYRENYDAIFRKDGGVALRDMANDIDRAIDRNMKRLTTVEGRGWRRNGDRITIVRANKFKA